MLDKRITEEMLRYVKFVNSEKTFWEFIDDKVLSIFGTGTACKQFKKEFPVEVSYYLDNNEEKWESLFEGKLIKNPEILQLEDKNRIFIFIASMYYDEISSQLEEMGLLENIHYIDAFGIMRDIERNYYLEKHKNALEYPSVTDIDLVKIERDFISNGIDLHSYIIDLDKFEDFKRNYLFPKEYPEGYLYVKDEKLLEHFVAYDLLELSTHFSQDVYVDVAACSSPWVKILRQKNFNAYAIDLNVPKKYSELSFYMKQDATKMDFDNESIKSISLQCAFEMFVGEDDIDLIKEAARVLRPGGKVIISPLYMHTHYCSYSSPDCFEKGYSDKNSKEYINRKVWQIPSSRKYDVLQLKKRVLDIAVENGLAYRIYVLENKKEIGEEIYLHFILELSK